MTRAVKEFERLLYNRLLPEFCSDPARRCELKGFRRGSVNVGEEDARYFLLAYEAGLVKHRARGEYVCLRSAGFEQFFWEGQRTADPRPFTLWLEPVITIAGLARLHFDFGWPAELIATQSADWAFDLVAFLPDRSTEFVAGEVKKTSREVEQLIELMMFFGRHASAAPPKAGKARNAYKKIAALRARQPPLFWALGPNGLSRAFEAKYGANESVELVPVANHALSFPGAD